MSALSVFLRKEALETVRTWRIWLLPGLFLFIGLSSPVLASLTPKLVESIAKSQPGVVLVIPPPTFQDAFGQWLKNLNQLVLWVVIISGAGLVSSEVRSGTAAVVLSKPLSRVGFVLSRALSAIALLVASTCLGTLLVWASTHVVFGEAPFGPLVAATAVWLFFAAAMSAVMILLSSVVSAQLGAAGLGMLVFAAVHLSGLYRPFVHWGPAGLIEAAPALLAGGSPPLAGPLIATGVLSAVAIGLGAWSFTRREL